MEKRNKKKKKVIERGKREESLSLSTETNFLCPICKVPLKSAILHNVEVNYCPKCLGIWFEEGELKEAKDNENNDLRWFDVDLWDDPKKMKIARGIRLCPTCRMPLYEVRYGDSNIIVDVCNLCHGVWLDRAEFKKIIDYLRKREDYEILHNYTKDLFHQLGEIFIGPEPLKEEILDFISVLKILNYKFVAQHPEISKIILSLPK